MILYYDTRRNINIDFGSFMAAKVKGSSGTLLSQRIIKNVDMPSLVIFLITLN